MSLSTQKKPKPVDTKDLLPRFEKPRIPRPLIQQGTWDNLQRIRKRERLLDTDATIKWLMKKCGEWIDPEQPKYKV